MRLGRGVGGVLRPLGNKGKKMKSIEKGEGGQHLEGLKVPAQASRLKSLDTSSWQSC